MFCIVKEFIQLAIQSQYANQSQLATTDTQLLLAWRLHAIKNLPPIMSRNLKTNFYASYKHNMGSFLLLAHF